MFRLSLISVMMIFIFASVSMAEFYYSDNRQIGLGVDSSKVAVLFNEGTPWHSIEEFISDYPRIDSQAYEIEIHDDFQIFSLNSGKNLDDFLDTLALDPRVEMVNPAYTVRDSVLMMVGRTILCKFYDYISYATIDNILTEHGVLVVQENENSPKRYLLSVSDSAQMRTLDIANALYELSETEYAHPNFLGGFEWHDYIIYDHYWEEQWGMHRVFEASLSSPRHRALEITRGDSDIVIAVIDQGVGSHEDIASNGLVAGYDFECMDNDPSPCPKLHAGWHGMGVAGIITSSHNRDTLLQPDRNTGIYGVAPNCRIMPIKIGSGRYIPTREQDENCQVNFVTDDKLAGSIAWAWTHGADIISCSWGKHAPVDDLGFEIGQAFTLGRDGKGCGLFFSAGNTGNDWPGLYPVTLPEVISVGAIRPDDSLWFYSSYTKVDVVAPSGASEEAPIWSLDQMDSLGAIYPGSYYTCGDPPDYDYLCIFGGTSAAQPIAAGTAALVLSKRPDLPVDSLYKIIRLSADPNLRDTITNPPDQKYGYGMVHPLRALLAVSRGDANNSGTINILDATYLISFLYKGGPAPTPDYLMGDANCSGVVSILDATYIQAYLYGGAPMPPICFNYGN